MSSTKTLLDRCQYIPEWLVKVWVPHLVQCVLRLAGTSVNRTSPLLPWTIVIVSSICMTSPLAKDCWLHRDEAASCSARDSSKIDWVLSDRSPGKMSILNFVSEGRRSCICTTWSSPAHSMISGGNLRPTIMFLATDWCWLVTIAESP